MFSELVKAQLKASPDWQRFEAARRAHLVIVLSVAGVKLSDEALQKTLDASFPVEDLVRIFGPTKILAFAKALS